MNETLKGASHNAPRNESHSGARGRFSRAPLERNLIFKIEHFGVGLLYIFERRRAPKRREARVNLLPYPPLLDGLGSALSEPKEQMSSAIV